MMGQYWTDEQKEAFVESLRDLADKANRSISDRLISKYFEGLSLFQPDVVLNALDRLYYQGHGFPEPADIITAISGKPEDQAEHAWQIVMEALARIGTYQSIEFRDPIINAVLRELVGTWADMRKHDDGENGLVWLGRDFKKLYCDYLRKGMVPEVGHLPGATELDNKRRGLYDAIKEPVAFGPGPQAPIKKLAPPKNKPLPSGKVRALTEKVKGVA